MACCRVKCLKDAVMPIIWLNCVFCMGVFEIPWHRPRFFFSIVYAVTMVTGYFALLYKGIIIFEETFSYNLTLFYCVVTVNILVATCSVILYWRKSQNFNILLKRMGHADDTLEALGMKKNYRKIFRVIVSNVMVWIACMMLLNITHIVWMWHDNGYMSNLYTALCFGFPIMLNSVVDVTFASFVRCIKTKFQYTNILINDVVVSANGASILKIHNEPKKTPIAIVGSKYKNDKDRIKHLVQTLMQLHLELTRIAQEINGTYCLQLLLELAVHFTIVTAVCYSLYSVFAGVSRVGNEKITAMIIWGAVYSLKIILMNNLCTMTSYEAYKTGEIVQTFEGSYLDDELREEIRQFTEQIVLNSLYFTAAGFFKINNALTGSFFATVTTYVVILIQISAPT